MEVGPVGSRALMSLRVEKGYGSWGRDYSPEYWPQETGLAGLIKMDKDFLNKSAYAALADTPPREVLRTLVIEVTTADATGNEPIFDLAGKPAGKVSSGAYGYHVGQSLALAYLRPDIAAGTELHVMVLGQPHRHGHVQHAGGMRYRQGFDGLAHPVEEVARIPTPANHHAHETELVILRNKGPVNPTPKPLNIELKMIGRTIPAN